MNDHSSQFEAWIEAYADGSLDADDRARFESEVATNPKLAEQVEIAKCINRTLRASFAPPDPPPELVARLEGGPGVPTPGGGPVALPHRSMSIRTWLIGTSAACAVVVSLSWLWVFLPGSRESGGGYQKIAMETIYDQTIARGFEPLWECPPHEFASTFARRQGEPLLLERLPANTEMVGLSYLAGLQPTSTCMLARVGDHPVLVWVERVAKDREVAAPTADSGLHLFREVRFGLVFYELSPLAQPTLLSHFVRASQIPDKDASWPLPAGEG